MAKCKMEDDAGVVCNTEMTTAEKRRDGMCLRCAELAWAWQQNPDKPLLLRNLGYTLKERLVYDRKSS